MNNLINIIYDSPLILTAIENKNIIMNINNFSF